MPRRSADSRSERPDILTWREENLEGNIYLGFWVRLGEETDLTLFIDAFRLGTNTSKGEIQHNFVIPGFGSVIN